MCDGLGSSFAALFGVLPNTSFSQNVGLVAMTKVVNRFALATGAVVVMFSSIVISGIAAEKRSSYVSRRHWRPARKAQYKMVITILSYYREIV